MIARRCLTAALAVLLIVGFSLSAQSREAPAGEESVEQRVEELEGRVARLQTVIDSMSAQLDELRRQLVVAPLVRLQAPVELPYRQQSMPPNAAPFRFNGMTFYVLPLSAQPND